MFDFANSSYTTVIVTVVYAIIFPQIIVGDAPEYTRGNLLWSVALSLSYFVVVLTAPVLGAIMDFSASKKRFLFASYILTVIASAALYFVGPGNVTLGMILILLSNLGFASGESFASSFLPDLGPQEELGKISGFAWGLGYAGGLISTAIVIFGLGELRAENFENLRWVGPVTGAFFLFAAIPTFVFLRERGTGQPLPAGSNYVSIGIERTMRTLKDIRDFRDLTMFLVSLFFSQAGLNIVISFAFIYGAQIIKWQPSTMIFMFIITQVTAAAGAIFFGFIQDRMGAIRTYLLTLLLWILAVVLIFLTHDLTEALNDWLGTRLLAEQVFLGVGSIAGLGLGATQSAGRAMVGIFSPESKSGEFFGFWGFSGKLSAIPGILGLGVLQSFIGLQRAILFTAVLFFIGILFALFVHEERGKATARNHEGD